MDEPAFASNLFDCREVLNIIENIKLGPGTSSLLLLSALAINISKLWNVHKKL